MEKTLSLSILKKHQLYTHTHLSVVTTRNSYMYGLYRHTHRRTECIRQGKINIVHYLNCIWKHGTVRNMEMYI